MKITMSNYIILDATDYIRQFSFPKNLNNLKLKDGGEFHVSLLKFPDDLEQNLREKVYKITLDHEKSFAKNPPKLNGDFKLALDKEKGSETIIGMINFPNLKTWQNEVQSIVPNVKFSISHVTLYANKYIDGRAGVGLNSWEKFNKLTSDLPERTERLLRSIIEDSDKM